MKVIFLRPASIKAPICIISNNLKIYMHAITFMTQKIFSNALLGLNTDLHFEELVTVTQTKQLIRI
jgi:hypothetical protein